jgi:hypothetical protein
MVVRLDKYRKTCGHCGAADVGSFSAGYGSAYGEHLCHPNGVGRPLCYDLVTRFRHPMPCRCFTMACAC